MTKKERTKQTKQAALEHGADLVGVVKVEDLSEHRERIDRMMPGAQSILVVATRHSLGSLRSGANELAQFDTIHAYHECARAAHATARFLESLRFPSAAVPAFIPLDMDEPGKGMRGEICWRRAGVRAGLGSYGESGALVTKEYGQAVRLSGVVTTADLSPDASLKEDICDHCMRCIEACPVKALSGKGKINKKLCGDHIFKFGFRYFQKVMEGMMARPTAELREIVHGHGLREIWQTFMTGNYYYCFKCQSQCPTTRLPV
ncbi:MAG: epoxyqueuosine reductase [Desulfobacterales bacterium]|nr:MAG: epoxyqueuosine reductase [Desulfobacterales bacterium]